MDLAERLRWLGAHGKTWHRIRHGRTRSNQEAEAKIAGCERCCGEEADHPFDCVLADVLGKHGAFEFMLTETAHCQNCRAELAEKSLVEPQGGIEVKRSREIAVAVQ
jgi:hypothetical protein